jgi:hypothetical protein
MATVEKAMPIFFEELLKDGQIDRAMAVARGVVRTEWDAWVPALYLRLKSGSLWYQPGFGGTAEADSVSWDSLCEAAVQLDLVPVVGPDLAEHILGTSTELAAKLAGEYGIPHSPEERSDSAKVAQSIKTNSAEKVLYTAVKRLALERIKETAIRLHRVAGQAALPDPSDLTDQADLLDFIVDQLYQDPDDPLRILAELNIKVFVSGAMDILLKRFLKKAGKVPVELFADWRDECEVDVARIVEAANRLYEDTEKAPGTPPLDVFDIWKERVEKEILESLRKKVPEGEEPEIPLSVRAGIDNIEERLLDNPGVPALDTIRAWRESVQTAPSELNKQPWDTNTPVLYYVYGKALYEKTWVLTEDDFFDYLIRHSTYKLLPKMVGEKLVAGSLLFLGFSLDDWKFRILFRLIMAKGGSKLRESYKHVGVQVDPEDYTPAEAARLKPLLVNYFGDKKISIYWGSSSDFLKEFRDHMEEPKYKGRKPEPPPVPARRRAKE